MTPGRQYLINRVAELEHMASTLLDQKAEVETTKNTRIAELEAENEKLKTLAPATTE